MSTASSFKDLLVETALKGLDLEVDRMVAGTYHPSLTKWFGTGDDSQLLSEPGSGMRFKMDIEVDVGHWTISVYELSLEDHLVLIVENHHDEPDVYSLKEVC